MRSFHLNFNLSLPISLVYCLTRCTVLKSRIYCVLNFLLTGISSPPSESCYCSVYFDVLRWRCSDLLFTECSLLLTPRSSVSALKVAMEYLMVHIGGPSLVCLMAQNSPIPRVSIRVGKVN